MRRRKNIVGTIYLLHFSRPFSHARHYIGWTENLDQRIADHRAGRGARLIAAITAAEITFEVVRTWTGTRRDERKRHLQKNSPKLCPLCSGPVATWINSVLKKAKEQAAA